MIPLSILNLALVVVATYVTSNSMRNTRMMEAKEQAKAVEASTIAEATSAAAAALAVVTAKTKVAAEADRVAASRITYRPVIIDGSPAISGRNVPLGLVDTPRILLKPEPLLPRPKKKILGKNATKSQISINDLLHKRVITKWEAAAVTHKAATKVYEAYVAAKVSKDAATVAASAAAAVKAAKVLKDLANAEAEELRGLIVVAKQKVAEVKEEEDPSDPDSSDAVASAQEELRDLEKQLLAHTDYKTPASSKTSKRLAGLKTNKDALQKAYQNAKAASTASPTNVQLKALSKAALDKLRIAYDLYYAEPGAPTKPKKGTGV